MSTPSMLEPHDKLCDCPSCEDRQGECQECKGSGKITVGEFDNIDEVDCLCVRQAKAEMAGDMAHDLAKGN